MGKVRRVILYKHGVGFFESVYDVDGDAEVKLEFKVDEMNDVLKSLTVHDERGTVTSVSYDSHKPVSRLLEEIAIELPSSGGMTAILGQLRGAEVSVETQGRTLRGSILGLDQRPLTRENNKAVHELVLSLFGEGSMRNIPVAEIQSIHLLDESLRADLGYCLETLVRSYKRNTKQLSVFTRGEGQRTLVTSYLVEAPAWKSSYRLQLPTDAEQKPFWEGWALVDNPRDEDWEDVELTLVAGLPVSFRHDLYSPRYVARREIEVQREATVGPVQTAAAMSPPLAKRSAMAPDPFGGGGDPFAAQPFMDMEADAFAAPAAEYAERFAPPAMATVAAVAQQRASEVIAQSVGELFEYRLRHPVTVKRNQSALVPIVGHEAEAEKVVFYNQQHRAENPFAAVDLKNTTGLTLEGGPLLVIEQDSYAGEAMLDTLKPDERRVICYAVDLAVRVNTTFGRESQPVHLVKILHGTLNQYFADLETSTYVFQNNDDREKVCWLEHPLRSGWELYNTPVEQERTNSHYRFRFTIPARDTTSFSVTLQQQRVSSVQLVSLEDAQIEFFRSGGYFGDAAPQVDALIACARRRIQHRNETRQLQERINLETNEIRRCKELLSGLGSSTDEQRLRSRYVQQMEAAENRLPELQEEVRKKVQEDGAFEQQLAALASALQLEVAL